ncbi:hypothetical protein ACFL1V_05130 [Pseudomonadota bacterium]
MKAAIIRPLVVLIFLAQPLQLPGQASMPEPNWDRAQALQAIDKTDTQARLKPLFQLARTGSSAELLDALSVIELDFAMAAPAKDYLLFSFTLGLSDLDADAVDSEVLGFLSQYKARTLVEHDDHPGMAVPLFNVRAAAAGVQNRWGRQKATARAEELLRGPADEWVLYYLAADPTGRRGFNDALGFATPDQLRALGQAALSQLDEHPELTQVTAWAATETGNTDLLQQAIAKGGGPELSRILEAASRKLSIEDRIDLLGHSMEQSSDSNAALAIAHLAPSLLAEPVVREMLFSTLADRKLGAASALVLGASADPEIETRLSEIASAKSGLEGQRAALAIGARRAEKEAEL